MTLERPKVKVGMDIVGSDGDAVGQVKEVRENDLLVHRAMQRDIYIPFSAIHSCTDRACMLNIPAGQVDNMGWPSPGAAAA